jgi:hypothetical protein
VSRNIADSVRLENDEATYTLIIEDDMGSHSFEVNPDDVLQAVEGYRQHLAFGESVRVERERAHGISWEEYRIGLARTDPEWVDEMLAQADHSRKAARESYPRFHDAGDESQAA